MRLFNFPQNMMPANRAGETATNSAHKTESATTGYTGETATISSQNASCDISALIFDIDNTLYTNEAYLAHQINVHVQRFADLEGISFSQAEKRIADARAAFAATHNGAKTCFTLIMDSFGYPVDESIKWRNELIMPEKFLKKDEKLRAILESLSKRYKIISVTNNTEQIGWREHGVEELRIRTELPPHNNRDLLYLWCK